MAIEFNCPHCKVNLKAGSELAGTEGKCPNCKKAITVPTQASKGKNSKDAKGK
jgi:transposase-like protein